MLSTYFYRVLFSLTAFLFAAHLQAQSGSNNYTGMWWKSNEAGWGLNIQHQGDVLLPSWFTYDASGKVQWYLISGASRQANGDYVGEVFQFNGMPFSQINGGAAFTSSLRVGTASLSFPSASSLVFNYTINNISQVKTLERFNFATPPTCTFTTGSRVNATNFTDLWWNPNEAGWGFNMVHQSDSIFAAWYTYGANGTAMWLSTLATKQTDGSFKGDVNRPLSGTPFSQINNASATTIPLPKVGEITIRFSDGEHASISYTVDGSTQTKSLERFVFASPVSICTNATNNGGGNNNPPCFRENKVGDVRVEKITAADNSTYTISYRVTGTAVVRGENVVVVEQFNSANQRQAKQYVKQAGGKIETVQVDAFDPNNGNLISSTVYDPYSSFLLNPPLNQAQNLSFRATTTGPSIPGTILTDVSQSYTRIGTESVTVPFGSFSNACKIQSSGTVTVFGFASNTQSTTWSNAEVGSIKSFGNANNAGGSTGNTTSELQSFTPGN